MAEQPTLWRYLGRTFDPALDAERLGAVDAKVFSILQDGQWHRRRELVDATGGAAVNSSISRLRKRGVEIEAERDPAAPKDAGAWRYRYNPRGSP